MSSESLLQELQELRRDVASLSTRVWALEQRAVASGVGSPVTVNYAIPGAQFGELPSPLPVSSVGGSGVERGSSQSVQRPTGRAGEYTEEERRQIASSDCP